jgi:hypothetical protein
VINIDVGSEFVVSNGLPGIAGGSKIKNEI